MEIKDRVYGQINIKEPVLLELIESKPLQRLKGIKQSISNQTVSRFEHSLGVMILLKLLGASFEEQIAGLLHDVPHTAFSHVVDYVFTSDEHNHEFHEKFYKKIIINSEIPQILKKYNYDLDRILGVHNFPLLERALPNLCADRLDYSFRDRIAYKEDSSYKLKYLKSLIVKDNEIIFNDKNLAYRFAKDYLEMDYQHWSSPMEVALYQILANAIKVALEHNIISQDDLFQDDNFVYNKLKQSKDKDVLKFLNQLNLNLKIKDDKKDYDFYARNKLRFVDPKFVDSDGNILHTTKVFPDFKQELQKHKTWIERGNHIKIVKY